MTAEKSVSVIIPYYMQKQYIRETVVSALNQAGARMNVIVIDDGSPEPAAPYLEGLAGVTLIRRDNHGCALTRNFGLEQSTDEFVIFLDGDDVLQPGAVLAHLDSLAKNPRAALCFGAYRLIDDDGQELAPPYICRRRNNFRRMIFENNPMPSPGTAMMRREALLETGGFDPSFSAQVDDYDLYLRLIQRRPFARHSNCVLNYRQHGNNVSRDRSKMQKGTLEVLDRAEASGNLSHSEVKRLNYARLRWIHHYNPESTLRYRVRSLVFKIRTMLSLPPTAWFG